MRTIRAATATVVAAMAAAGCGPDLGEASTALSTEEWCTGFYPTGQVEDADLDDSGHVKEYLCRPQNRESKYGVYVVTIDRRRPSSEMWVLETPTADNTTTIGPTIPRIELDKKTIDAFAAEYGTLVAVNGFTFDRIDPKASPNTQVKESRHQLSGYIPPLDPTFSIEHLMGFGPNSGFGIPASLRIPPAGQITVPPGTGSLYDYNAYGSRWPILVGGLEQPPEGIPPYDEGPTVWAAVGFSGRQIVIVFGYDELGPFGPTDTGKYRTTLQAFGVLNAVLQDGGNSAGMHLTSPTAIDGRTHVGRTPYGGEAQTVAYGVGLVTLGDQLLKNGQFDLPSLAADDGRGDDKIGRRNYSPTKLRQYGATWRGGAGGADYYSSAWNDSGGTPYKPMSGAQIAALRPNTASDVLKQHVPTTNNYCMLHLLRAFSKNSGCDANHSTLTVTIENIKEPAGPFVYYNSETDLQEEWLRFHPLVDYRGDAGVDLTFHATDTDPRCEVLIDDVTVRCVVPAVP